MEDVQWSNPSLGPQNPDTCLELVEENVDLFNSSNRAQQAQQAQHQHQQLAFPNQPFNNGYSGSPNFYDQFTTTQQQNHGFLPEFNYNGNPENHPNSYKNINPIDDPYLSNNITNHNFDSNHAPTGTSSSISSFSSPVTNPTRFNIRTEGGSQTAENNKVPSPDTSSTSTSALDTEKPIMVNTNNNGKTKQKSGLVKSKKQLLDEQDAILMARDDSELNEEELAKKRKAQNRAAQRAFRERKETKLKDLEIKLLQSEDERQKLLQQLDQIRQHNLTMQTENQLLRSGNDAPSHHIGLYAEHANRGANKFTFPQNPREFVESLYAGTSHKIKDETYNKIYEEPDEPGKKVLAVGAVWDYLQIKAEQPEYEGKLDCYEVMLKLKGSEKCHGFGPAYPLELVDKAINDVANGI